ncbi:TetR/AcrR family transcriptional regulator [Mycobacterium vicinigordonae]|uniref:TetR/AcrR family transcriptional regulator n=1 Tax=Mycobacterium vicinigordonae TaxID=1719132 RepID=A0A7D6DZW2_9MYCO|nr:TetR/AcrR family transcriptional regulator [Mycobacterium vicinigordonae]QLL08727.1 TetR/AcrR family transcriptional regulator [Mycobacterium vicinigordonae]
MSRRSRPVRRTTSARRPPGRPADVDSDDTRRLILDSAEQLFSDKGFATTTLKAIAENAGMTQGTVYHHFRTKHELFEAVNDRANDRMLIPMGEAAEAQRTFAGKLASVFDVATEIVRTQPLTAQFVAVVRLETRRHVEIADTGGDLRWARLWRDLVDTGVRTGEIDAADRDWALAMLVAVFLGLGQVSVELDFDRYQMTVDGFKRAFPHSFITPRNTVARHNPDVRTARRSGSGRRP